MQNKSRQLIASHGEIQHWYIRVGRPSSMDQGGSIGNEHNYPQMRCVPVAGQRLASGQAAAINTGFARYSSCSLLTAGLTTSEKNV
jgi:hypothetical protein